MERIFREPKNDFDCILLELGARHPCRVSVLIMIETPFRDGDLMVPIDQRSFPR